MKELQLPMARGSTVRKNYLADLTDPQASPQDLDPTGQAGWPAAE
jgi:hypothetical protein